MLTNAVLDLARPCELILVVLPLSLYGPFNEASAIQNFKIENEWGFLSCVR